MIDVFERGGGGNYPVRRLYNGADNITTSTKDNKSCPASETLVLASLLMPSSVTPSMQRFDSLKELVEKCETAEWDLSTQYFKPKSGYFSSIDFIGPGLKMFQVTVSPRHSLLVTSGRSDKEGLLPLALELLPLVQRWDTPMPYLDVYFLVIEGTAKKWTTAQPLKLNEKPQFHDESVVKFVETAVERKEGNTSGFSIGGKVVEIRQYVVEVPLTVIKEWQQGEVEEEERLLDDDVDEASRS